MSPKAHYNNRLQYMLVTNARPNTEQQQYSVHCIKVLEGTLFSLYLQMKVDRKQVILKLDIKLEEICLRLFHSSSFTFCYMLQTTETGPNIKYTSSFFIYFFLTS